MERVKRITLKSLDVAGFYIERNIEFDGDVEIEVRACCFHVIGSIDVTGDITTKDGVRVGGVVKAGGDIKVNGSIDAGMDIRAGGDIRALGNIHATFGINAGGSIVSGGGIIAGTSIVAGENIEAGWVILTLLGDVKAQKISCKKIVAGLYGELPCTITAELLTITDAGKNRSGGG